MKKVKINSKLSLNKEVVTKLNDDQMTQMKGGLFKSRFLCKKKDDPVPDPASGAISCRSCTGNLCNTCNGC